MKNRISYSQFSMWGQCPLRWKLNYVDKLKRFSGNIHTVFGSAMHTVLQTYLTTFYSKTITEADSLDLNDMLFTELKNEFIESKKTSEGDPCTKEDLQSFYKDGVSLLDWFKKNKSMYFSKRGYELLGIEIELNYKLGEGLNFIGFMDVVIKDTVRDRIKIIDLKTSTKGWNKWMKADKVKTNQLLLYKQFYSKEFDVPTDKIDIEYFILKRKLYENVDFPQRKVQLFTPAHGKPSLNKVLYKLKEFVDSCFDEQGNYLLKEYDTNESKKTCRFCEFNQTEYCDKGIK